MFPKACKIVYSDFAMQCAHWLRGLHTNFIVRILTLRCVYWLHSVHFTPRCAYRNTPRCEYWLRGLHIDSAVGILTLQFAYWLRGVHIDFLVCILTPRCADDCRVICGIWFTWVLGVVILLFGHPQRIILLNQMQFYVQTKHLFI